MRDHLKLVKHWAAATLAGVSMGLHGLYTWVLIPHEAATLAAHVAREIH